MSISKRKFTTVSTNSKRHVEEKLEVILDEHLTGCIRNCKGDSKNDLRKTDVIEVTARQYDRDLAATRPSITINGETALWSNKWIAGGNEITWI
jgi:preprotein translocase subunit SecA